MEEQKKQEIMEDRQQCKKCGQWLPLDHFKKKAIGEGLQSVCRDCQLKKHRKTVGSIIEKKAATENALSHVSSRELLAELRRRGYQGDITFVQKIRL